MTILTDSTFAACLQGRDTTAPGPVRDALRHFHTQDYPAALAAGLRQAQRQPGLPNAFIGFLADCASRCERQADLSEIILRYAEAAIDRGQHALAMAAIKQIYSFCYDMRLLQQPELVQRVARAHLRIAQAQKPIAQPPLAPAAKRRPRLAMVTVNLVDHVQAYAKTAMQFARYLDRDRYDCYLYFTEATWSQRPQSFALRFDTPHSIQRAPIFCRELQQSDATTAFCPALPFDASARWLAQQLTTDAIDAVIFQGGINAPIMWTAAHLAPIPARLNLCLGVNMYQPGLDATVYMNRANLDRERAWWDPAWGHQLYIGGGADLREAAQAPIPDRARLGIPADAITFGTLTNYVDSRITDAYLDCVATILRNCPRAIFLCLGGGSPARAQAHMAAAGLADRCRWLPQQSYPMIALKLLDLYVNEFPVGGSQSIRECLACGIPAIAMRCSASHHESVGADIVGDACAIPRHDPAAYADLALSLLHDEAARATAARQAHHRAANHYSAEHFIGALANTMISIARQKHQQPRTAASA